MDYDVAEFERDQDLFNEISGQANKVSKEDLVNQLLLIQEEVSEIAEGLRNNDLVEVLDGAIDTLFVTLGLIQKLRNKGVNTDLAMACVANNNLTKFIKSPTLVNESVVHYQKLGISVTPEYNLVREVYVLKDENDKVKKPVGYVSVDLTECVPDNVHL